MKFEIDLTQEEYDILMFMLENNYYDSADFKNDYLNDHNNFIRAYHQQVSYYGSEKKALKNITNE